MYNRIILKLSGEALGNGEEKLDPNTLDAIASQIVAIVDKGVKVAVVVGGGNFARGRSLSALGMDRTSADYIGMLGTVMNALALQAAIRKAGRKALAVSAIRIDCVTFFERDLIKNEMDTGTVIIFGGGIANPYFSTDSTAALRACQLEAEVILMAKNGVDGVYDSDPDINPDAKRFDCLTFNDILLKNLKVIDATAAGLCRENHISAFVFDMGVENNIINAVSGNAIGTLIKED